jgi:predicted GIY-YIG superfamily endonuclease
MKYVVYMITYDDVIVYIGKTNDFKRRCREHKYKGTKNSSIPVEVDLDRVNFIPTKEFNNREEALKYEDELIIKYNLKCGSGWNKIRSGLISLNRNEYCKIEHQTERYKEYMKLWQREYRKSDKYKTYRKELKERKKKCN